MRVEKVISGYVDPNREILIELANRLHIKSNLAEAIFSSPDIEPRRALCRNPHMQKEILNTLCVKQKEPELVYDLMANPNISLRSFFHLLRHARKFDDPFIYRFGLIRHGEVAKNATINAQ